MKKSYVYRVTEAGTLYVQCLRQNKISTIVKKLKKFHDIKLDPKYTNIRLLPAEEVKVVIKYICSPLHLF